MLVCVWGGGGEGGGARAHAIQMAPCQDVRERSTAVRTQRTEQGTVSVRPRPLLVGGGMASRKRAAAFALAAWQTRQWRGRRAARSSAATHSSLLKRLARSVLDRALHQMTCSSKRCVWGGVG